MSGHELALTIDQAFRLMDVLAFVSIGFLLAMSAIWICCEIELWRDGRDDAAYDDYGHQSLQNDLRL